jgi:O-antigen chain-terminating methyltransferase
MRNDSTLRETAVLTDYVRALLIQRGSVSSIQTTTGAETRDDLDTFYVALEDEFRGTPELIKNRLSVYLPLISSANLKGPAVDLGCGRGEWLELMRDAAVAAIGVEQNSLLVAANRDKGLQILESDFQSFLEQSPAQHWQLVTGFHVIEHLGWPGWYGALRHMYRALQPGGMLILETPDPANLYTSANRFFLDPTHRHPLPDILLEFAARSVGFASVEVLKLHPEPGIDQHGVGPEAVQLLGRLTGAQDYALIARK